MVVAAVVVLVDQVVLMLNLELLDPVGVVLEDLLLFLLMERLVYMALVAEVVVEIILPVVVVEMVS